MTWNDVPEPPAREISWFGWILVVVRGVPLAVLFLAGFPILLAIRLVELLTGATERAWSAWYVHYVFWVGLRIIGLRLSVKGSPLKGPGAIVANHSSWLDIFALYAWQEVFFVSKAEVAAWPVIGTLAKGAGTVFIRRHRPDAAKQKAMFEDRLKMGHRLVFFPEGTTSDGLRVLPFKSTLFAAFFADGLRDILQIQPVSVIYSAPKNDPDQAFYGWWGDMAFGPSLLKVLATPSQGQIDLILHPGARVCDFRDRKALSAHCEALVRGPFSSEGS